MVPSIPLVPNMIGHSMVPRRTQRITWVPCVRSGLAQTEKVFRSRWEPSEVAAMIIALNNTAFCQSSGDLLLPNVFVNMIVVLDD